MRKNQVWERDRKHHEEVRQRVEKEADKVRVCKTENADETLHEKFLQESSRRVVLHVTEEIEKTETPISPRSPAFLLFALTLPLPLPLSAYTCIH